jgi:catechol 2,3-dioxygenase-like lactoylglutathione lyase family enzyme
MIEPADYYHTGFVVADLVTAAARLTALSGYTWTTPIEATLPLVTRSGDYEVPFRFVYSIQAPHLELVQAVPGTIWSAMADAAAHHLGYWVDDLAAAAAALERAGYRQEARPAGNDLSRFAYYTDDDGFRIEVVDRAMFPDWRGFLASMASTAEPPEIS